MSLRLTAVLFGITIFVWGLTGGAQAGVISQSKEKVTQVKIVHSGSGSDNITTGILGKNKRGAPSQPTAWGVYSNYIGPGDINKLVGIDIYLDSEYRISFIKVTRESYTGDLVTSIFTNVSELSIQTLKSESKRPYKETPIIIRTADSLTFP